MNPVQIRLEELSIRLRGVSRVVAQSALDGLGDELGRHLARLPMSSLPTGSVFRISLDALEVTDPRDITALREAIAQRIVAGLSDDRARVPEVAVPLAASAEPEDAEDAS